MPIDLYADDNESQIRFLAERVDSLNTQVELLLEALSVLSDRVKELEAKELARENREWEKSE